MRRVGIAMLLSLLAPTISSAATDRERSFAVCLTITPGLGAASLGHPGRGAANFALYTGGTGLFALGATSIDKKGRPNGALMTVGGAAVIGSYVWALIDGLSLEPSEDFTYVRPLPKEWRPGQDAARPQATPPPQVSTPVNGPESNLPAPSATPKPIVPHVPEPSGKAFIKTQVAGLQEVEVGRYVRALRTDGPDVLGTIVEVSTVAIVVDPGDGSRILIPATTLRQVQAARKP